MQAALLAILNFMRVELRARISQFLERAMQSSREQDLSTYSRGRQYRTAERWLVSGRGDLELAMYRRLANSFMRHEAGDIAYENLQILDDEALKVVMLRARFVNSVMEMSREKVVALEVRLASLEEAGAKINVKAFSPGAVADGFLETFREFDLPPEVQMLLLEVYSAHGVEMLDAFYRDLNELLIKEGVLPGFKYSIGKAQAAHPEPAAPGFAAGARGLPGTGGGGSASGAGGPGGGFAGGAPGGPGFGAGLPGTYGGPPPTWPSGTGVLTPEFAYLIDLKLAAMEQALARLTAEHWQPGALRQAFSLPPPISLSPEQEESLDHIEAVFLDLIRDTRISARFRSELNRLVLPLMSLRLSDLELFKNPENPVRRFLRQLALLGFRDQEVPIQEFEHISLVVGRIVSERAQHLDSFNSGADALYTIARNEVRRQLRQRQQPEPPAPPDHQAAQAAVDANRYARDELLAASAGLQLPTVVQHFVLGLLGPWIMLTYQEHGGASEELRDCSHTAHSFFTLLEPSATEEEHAYKVRRRQEVLDRVALETMKRRSHTGDAIILLEGIAAYFDELRADSRAGLARGEKAEALTANYLDDLPVVRLSDAP